MWLENIFAHTHRWRGSTQIEYSSQKMAQQVWKWWIRLKDKFCFNDLLTKSNRTEIQTYKVEERTFGTLCRLAIRRLSSSGDLRPPTDRFFGPLDRATQRPWFQSNSNIIQPRKLLIALKWFQYTYWVVMFLPLTTTGVFYGFLNIYKIAVFILEDF